MCPFYMSFVIIFFFKVFDQAQLTLVSNEAENHFFVELKCMPSKFLIACIFYRSIRKKLQFNCFMHFSYTFFILSEKMHFSAASFLKQKTQTDYSFTSMQTDRFVSSKSIPQWRCYFMFLLFNIFKQQQQQRG